MISNLRQNLYPLKIILKKIRMTVKMTWKKMTLNWTLVRMSIFKIYKLNAPMHKNGTVTGN